MAKNISSTHKLQVLIVEDDPDYLDYYTEWVSNMGYFPIPTDDFRMARKILQSQEIDIAVIDLFLDESSDKAKGLLLFKDIFELHGKSGWGPLIIAVSGDKGTSTSEMEEISDYQSLGIVTAFLSKKRLDRNKMQSVLKMAADKKMQRVTSRRGLDTPSDPSVSQLLRVFLCYSSSDKNSVRELYKWLSAEKDIDPWLDTEKLLPGQDWDFEIENALHASDVIVICCSADSVKKEGYVQKEIKRALDIAEEKPEGTIFIIPLKLDECQLPRRLTRWQWVNLFDEDGYDKLVRSLRHRASMLAR